MFNKVVYTINTRGYENKKVVVEIIKTQRNHNTRKLRFHNLKANIKKEINIYSAYNETKMPTLHFKIDFLGTNFISLSKDLKTLTKKIY